MLLAILSQKLFFPKLFEE
ncbi:hypothetical protein E2320_017122, partial [Naja naja]